MVLRVYLHPNCSTCQRAVAWLEAKGLAHEAIDLRATPPAVPELRAMLGHLGKLSKLCNTSGQEYRRLGLSERLPTMTEAEALALLASHGMLIKRPFLLTPAGGVVGFREAQWEALLA